LAKALLCQANQRDMLEACGACDSCIQVDAMTHPDLIVVAKPVDKAEMPLSMFIGDKEDRMRIGLCHDIAMRPFMGGRKVAIIDDADSLNEEGANCLLKTLEEPPPRSVLILIGTSAERQLPTIRSRSQIIRFQPLATDIVVRLLEQKLGVEPNEARRLAQFSSGSLECALELADESLWGFRRRLLDALVRPQLDSVAFAKPLLAFIDEAGKEAPPRRRRMKLIIGVAVEFYRQLLRGLSGLPVQGDDEIKQAVTHKLRIDSLGNERIAACADHCLEAIEHVDRNANQSTLIEAWLDGLRA
jgi:DNA polymerase-3 subunit delta'